MSKAKAWIIDRLSLLVGLAFIAIPGAFLLTGSITLWGQVLTWLKTGYWQYYPFWERALEPVFGGPRPHFTWAVPDRLLQGLWSGEAWFWCLVMAALTLLIEIWLFGVAEEIWKKQKALPPRQPFSSSQKLWLKITGLWLVLAPFAFAALRPSRHFWDQWFVGLLLAGLVALMMFGFLDWRRERREKAENKEQP